MIHCIQFSNRTYLFLSDWNSLGIAENTPKESAFVGPVDPTVNVFFPEDYMALGIPLSMAVNMHKDLNDSFAVKTSEVTYPKIRDKIRR